MGGHGNTPKSVSLFVLGVPKKCETETLEVQVGGVSLFATCERQVSKSMNAESEALSFTVTQ